MNFRAARLPVVLPTKKCSNPSGRASHGNQCAAFVVRKVEDAGAGSPSTRRLRYDTAAFAAASLGRGTRAPCSEVGHDRRWVHKRPTAVVSSIGIQLTK